MASLPWWLEILREIIANREKLKILFSPTKYLKYNPVFLCDTYQEDTPIEDYVPYKQEVCWIRPTWEETCEVVNNISVYKMSKPFKLGADPVHLKSFQGHAYNEFWASGKLTRDSDVIRLESLNITQKETKLTTQKAKYSDQVQSNLVMNWTNDHALKKIGITTLRAYFASQYPRKLPPLSEQRLANTIGIALILFYRNSYGTYVPYLPARAKGVINKKKILAVFEGGYHCTSSGAVEWSEGETFDQIFTEDMYKELKDEVELERDDVEVMLPVALCREFLRGGKPQIFFAGLTELSETQLAERRKIALKKQKALNDKVEIKDEQLVVPDNNELKRTAEFQGLTLEAIANLHYGERFLTRYLTR